MADSLKLAGLFLVCFISVGLRDSAQGLKTKTVCDSWFIDLSLNCMANEMLNVTSITLHPKEPYTCSNPAQSNCSKNMTRLLGRRCSNRRRCSLSELPLYARTCCRRLLNCLSVNYTCVPASCGAPPSILNGNVTSTDPAYGPGAIATYSCGKGLKLDTKLNDATITCTSFGAFSRYRWNGYAPHCTRLVSSCPGHPNGKVVSFRHLCYEFVEVRKPWSGAKSECESNKGMLANVDNEDAEVFLYDTMGSLSRTYGWQRSAKFWIDHWRSGRKRKKGRCNYIDRSWRGWFWGPARTACTEQNYFICEYGGNNATRCERVPTPRYGSANTSSTLVNTTASFTCDPGYTLNGSSIRQCLPSGLWAGAPTTCTEVNCGAPEKPDYGRVVYDSTTYQSVATYSCDAGYTPHGQMQRICSKEGKWSGDLPSCMDSTLPEVNCGPPKKPDNGRVMYKSTTYLSVAKYSCDVGYTAHGEKLRICSKEGKWSGDLPSCMDSSVPIPKTDKHNQGNKGMKDLAIPIGAGVGALILIAVGVAVAVMVKRAGGCARKAPSEEVDTGISNPLYDQIRSASVHSGEPEPIYDVLSNGAGSVTLGGGAGYAKRY